MKLLRGAAALAAQLAVTFALIGLFAGCWNNSRGNHDVDLAGAIWLTAEAMPTAVDTEGVPPESGGTTTPVNNLFSLPPGTNVNVSALSATIDPTGTSIVNDFDGDGILNANETTTNVWVADYPMVEAVIATPVTMKIRIAQSTQTTNDEIVSEITSDDYVSNKNEGSEKIHQNELNEKTVQYQDSYSRSDEVSNSTTTSASYGLNAGVTLASMASASVGLSYSTSVSNSWSAKHATAETTTKWADKPFKNNLDSDAWSLKSDASAQKARKYRVDRSSKIDSTSRVDANAGYVRAPLYIKNLSVNMPVKLSNILCSLMFETSGGELIPVQSFRLRNEDYSLFEVEVYGGTEFGPYVIELNGLNTAEVENAIAKGYSPKIFIVDYEMTHVPDSNYRSMLLNFSGDNLKIVEENSKGRTAQIKVFGPNIREKYRVSAFSTNNGTDPCSEKSAAVMSPGVSLRNALDRIACSGLEIEYEDYVVDLSEIGPTLSEPKIHIHGIKSIGGVRNSVPCTALTKNGSDGVSRTACVQKPMNEWTEEETQNAGIWAIFSNGKYYAMTEYWRDGGEIRVFDPGPGNVNSPIVKGTDSMIWAGDYYDIVYIRFADFIKKVEQHGSNPLESGVAFKQNTLWDLATLGEHPYDPDTKSKFLGEVGFGERIEVKIKLDQTQYLSPNFGAAKSGGAFEYFDGFSYNWKKSTSRYSIDQAADFEISMGFGGERSDWFHIVKDLDNSDPYMLKSCGRTLDYVSQIFTICVELPTRHAYVDSDVSLVKLYIRPSLNAAYRRTIWPLNYAQVRKVRAELATAASAGDMQIQVMNMQGTPAIGDDLYITGDTAPYAITSISAPGTDGSVTIQLGSSVRNDVVRTTGVFVKSGLTSPEMRLAVDSGFYSDWNADVQNNFVPGAWTTEQPLPMLYNGSVSCSSSPFHPASCIGFTPNVNALNWMGATNEGVAHWNSSTDGSRFDTFLSGGLYGLRASTGKGYRVEPVSNDFALSQAAGSVPYTEPLVLAYNNRMLVIWKRDTALKARWINIVSGMPESNEFALSTAPVTGKFVAKRNSSKAVIAWEGASNIYSLVFDLSTGTNVGSETVVAAKTLSGDTPQSLDVALAGDRGIVVWNATTLSSWTVWGGWGCDNNGDGWYLEQCYTVQYSFNYSINGRGIDLNTGGLDASSATIGGYSNVTDWGYSVFVQDVRVVASNDSFVVAWTNRNLSSQSSGVRTRTIANTNLSPVGSEVLIDSATGDINSFFMGYEGGQAFVLWRNPNGTLQGRGVDAATGALTGGGNITIDTAVDAARFSAMDGIGLITYSKGKQVFLMGINLLAGERMNSNGIPLGTMAVTARTPGRAAVVGNRVIAVWEQEESGHRTIRGRAVDLSSFKALGTGEFLVSTKNEGLQTGPVAALYGSNGTILWLSQDADQPRIRGLAIDLLNPGSLRFGLNNFFVAPLIERDYTIQARIKY